MLIDSLKTIEVLCSFSNNWIVQVIFAGREEQMGCALNWGVYVSLPGFVCDLEKTYSAAASTPLL